LNRPAKGGALRRSRRLALRLVILVCAMTGLLHAAAEESLSREAFTLQFVASLKAARPDVEIRALKPLRLQILDKGKVATADLTNAFLEYRLEPREIDTVIRRHLGAIASATAPARRRIERSRIVPVVKSRRWIADYAALVKEQGFRDAAVPVHEELNSELVVVYAEDRDKTYMFLLPGDVGRLGIENDELPLLARNNLARIAPPPELITGPYAYGIHVDGNYEASLILYPDWWEARPIEVDGDYVVAVPARDILMITGSNNRAGIDQLRALARQTVENMSHAIVDTLFVFRNGRFERFD
jgi:uncharacterized protein YtpQ (UPF0354 family)